MSNINSTNAKTLQVLTSTDYDDFKVLEGNRNINTLHFNRLKESMAAKYLISPIIVNQKFEVIDGQHRLLACKELKLPVRYIVCNGYNLEDIHRYNMISKNWTLDDFMNGYIELGKKEYEFYKVFKEKYGFGHGESISMVSGKNDRHDAVKKFQAGELKIKNYNNACLFAEKVQMIAPYYEGYRRRSFVLALLSLSKNSNFTIEEFVEKLKFQRSKFYDCGTQEQYVKLIEEIYNFKRREKVSLSLAA